MAMNGRVQFKILIRRRR